MFSLEFGAGVSVVGNVLKRLLDWEITVAWLSCYKEYVKFPHASGQPMEVHKLTPDSQRFLLSAKHTISLELLVTVSRT